MTYALEAATAKRFQFVGGELCLNFCNTLGGKRGVRTKENLHHFGVVISWCEQAQIISRPVAQTWHQEAASKPEAAEALLKRAVTLREAIYRVFAALIEGKALPGRDLALLNEELASGLGLRRLRTKGREFEWEWHFDAAHPEQALAPIACSAAELLASGDLLKHVHRCEGENCGWLFLDSSRNHSRRWCDMRDCGNRAKVRRHRKRHPEKDAGRTME